MIRDPALAVMLHGALEWAALVAGAWLYRYQRRKAGRGGLLSPTTYPIVLGCILGAAIGNKMVHWFEMGVVSSNAFSLEGWLLSGQSIVGGLLGGWLGVEAGKLVAGVHGRTGDDFVRPVLLGIVIGRTGCFLAGLHDGTYGLATSMPWGIDFGDGISRHPTQLYELLLALVALATHSVWSRKLAHQSGLTFRVLMLTYLSWRLFIDAFKPVPFAYSLGLSGIQWVCLVSITVISLLMIRDGMFAKNKKEVNA
jgi:phosphatidylglycerol---prolipoprotein diacylglyceryl transferase